MGMDPEKVEYLMEAGRFLGQARSELIEQRGEDPSRLAKQFRPAPRLRVPRRLSRAEHVLGPRDALASVGRACGTGRTAGRLLSQATSVAAKAARATAVCHGSPLNEPGTSQNASGIAHAGSRRGRASASGTRSSAKKWRQTIGESTSAAPIASPRLRRRHARTRTAAPSDEGDEAGRSGGRAEVDEERVGRVRLLVERVAQVPKQADVVGDADERHEEQQRRGADRDARSPRPRVDPSPPARSPPARGRTSAPGRRRARCRRTPHGLGAATSARRGGRAGA